MWLLWGKERGGGTVFQELRSKGRNTWPLYIKKKKSKIFRALSTSAFRALQLLSFYCSVQPTNDIPSLRSRKLLIKPVDIVMRIV